MQFLTQWTRAYAHLHRRMGRICMSGLLTACVGATAPSATSSAPFAIHVALAATALAWLTTVRALIIPSNRNRFAAQLNSGFASGRYWPISASSQSRSSLKHLYRIQSAGGGVQPTSQSRPAPWLYARGVGGKAPCRASPASTKCEASLHGKSLIHAARRPSRGFCGQIRA